MANSSSRGYTFGSTELVTNAKLHALVDSASIVVDTLEAGTVTVPVKCTGAEITEGTDDDKFATPKALADAGIGASSSWVDYSATSTIVGWTTFTAKNIRYCKIGKTVIVQVYISGTSNNTATTFTLPDTSSSATVQVGMAGVTDNGSVKTTHGQLGILASATLVYCYVDAASTTWTASGTKTVAGTLLYEAA